MGGRDREGVSEARVLKRNAYNIVQADVDMEEEEMFVRRGGTAKCLLFSWLVTLTVMDRVGWLTLGRLKRCEAYGERWKLRLLT